MKVALYLRVSTAAQSTDNQRIELERIAAMRCWTIVETYTDHGISGTKSRRDRPELDRMLKDAVRGRFDVVAVWSLDRLGRSLQHLIETVNELQSVGVDLYMHQQTIDTTTSAGRLAFSIFGAFAEFERSIIIERVRAGLARAVQNGTKLGRPTNMNETVRASIVSMRSKSIPIRQIAKHHRVGTASVYATLASAST